MEQQNNITQNAIRQLKAYCKTLTKFDNGAFGYKGKQIQVLSPSLPIDFCKEGSKNGLELDGISKFNFKIDQQINTYVFPVYNQQSNKVELIIVPTADLISRICDLNTTSGEDLIFRFWITERGIYETQGIGAEYEFLGLWLNENRCYNSYRNNFRILD